MANGMDFEAYGHPDAYTLNQSRIEEKLESFQSGEEHKFKARGDLAYFNDEYLVT